MKKISKYISFNEATRSQTAIRRGINNYPPYHVIMKMMLVGEKIHTPAREHFKKPIPVSSFYRSPELNKAIGGAASSQHVKGEALDMDVDGVKGFSNKALFDYIRENLEFDQLIAEGVNSDGISWVHCSYKETGNRNEVLIMYSRGGKTHYENYSEKRLLELLG